MRSAVNKMEKEFIEIDEDKRGARALLDGRSENFHVSRNKIAKFHIGHALTTFARIRFARIGFERTAEKIDDSVGRRGGGGASVLFQFKFHVCEWTIKPYNFTRRGMCVPYFLLFLFSSSLSPPKPMMRREAPASKYGRSELFTNLVSRALLSVNFKVHRSTNGT